MAGKPIYPGVEMTIGGQTYVVPPLSLGQVRRFQGQLQEWSGDLESKSVALAVEVIHAAMTRNYPDLTAETVEEQVDLGNMQELMLAVMDVSGMLRKAGDEKKARTTRTSTGTGSTAT